MIPLIGIKYSRLHIKAFYETCIDPNQSLDIPLGDDCLPVGFLYRPNDRRSPQCTNYDDDFTQNVVRHKGTPDSAFIRFNAERLRSTTRRDVGNAIAAPFSRCVIMRDTVSIVSPR